MSEVQHRGHPDFYKIIAHMIEIHDAKNRDYAGEKDPLQNFRACERAGIPAYIGAWARLSDKISRLEQLIPRSGERAVKDETIEDTFIDLANYAILTLILWRERKVVSP